MQVISSQRYLDEEIINNKMQQLKDSEINEITLPIVYAMDFDGEQLYILIDNHHTRQAAINLGLTINYEIIDAKQRYGNLVTGDDLLNQLWIDSNWYYLDNDMEVF